MPTFFLPNVCLHFSYLMYAYIYHTQCLHTFSLPNAYLHLPFPQEERKILDFWVLQLTTCSTFTYILFGTRYAFVISVTLSSSPCKQHSYKRSFSISSPPKKNFCFSLYMIFCRRMHCRAKTPHTGQWHLSKWQVVQGQLKAQLVKAHLCHWRPCFKSLSCHQWADI